MFVCADQSQIEEMIKELNFNQQGLIPVIVQAANTKEILMFAYANPEAIEKTIQSGEAHFWSRSRAELWHKGKTSGNIQKVLEIRYDCDADALLYLVHAKGPACHTGNNSCFFRTLYQNKDNP